MTIAREFMQSLMDEFRQLASTESILGTPMTFGNVTIVPVIRLALGVGAGGGEGGAEAGKDAGASKGNGAGGGGGVRVEPAAFIVLKGDDVQILAAPGRGGRIAEVFEHLPDLIGKVMSAREEGGKKGDDD
jgi:uncharacterized spore protein YtfJ